MAKTMTKYQLEHFKDKVKRNFNPLIEEQELLIKQFKTEATDKIVSKLAKKMGADKILNALEKAEKELQKAKAQAKTFFHKKAKKDEDGNKNLSYRMREDEGASLKTCREQLREWAETLVDAELRRRPEGKKLKQLEDLKTRAIDTVMEAGTSEELIRQLDATTKKIGIAWVVDTSKIKQISSN